MGLLRRLHLQWGRAQHEVNIRAVGKYLRAPHSAEAVTWMLSVLVDLCMHASSTASVVLEQSEYQGRTSWSVQVDTGSKDLQSGGYYQTEGTYLAVCLCRALASPVVMAIAHDHGYRDLVPAAVVALNKLLASDKKAEFATEADAGLTAFLGPSRWDV